MATLKLSPEVLTWAASQAGGTLAEIAQKITKKTAPIVERGELTTAQAVKLSQFAGVPFGYLFLEEPPPPRQVPLADFRTLVTPDPLSKDFFATFDEILFKQSWYKDYLIGEQSPALDFVGRFAGDKVAPEVVATDMRRTLRVDDTEIRKQNTSAALFNYLCALAEAAGILVFKNGIVGNNTRRSLSVSEFRGFAISDAMAPVIFINGTDAPAATVFTLAHELAHLWTGDSAISDAAANSSNTQEKFCNQVAAELLLPATQFLALWSEALGSITDKIEQVHSKVKVSRYVVARRALELDLIDARLHAQFYQQALDAVKKKKADALGGGDFYLNLPIRNSRKLTSLVTALATSGRMSFREAGNLLNTNPNNVMTLYAKK